MSICHRSDFFMEMSQRIHQRLSEKRLENEGLTFSFSPEMPALATSVATTHWAFPTCVWGMVLPASETLSITL